MTRMIPVIAALLLSACQPAQQPFNALTGEPELQAEAIVMGDGQALALKQWWPAEQEAKAIILSLHGFNDYSQAFDLPGHYFAARGIAVLAYDQRGFGSNTPQGIWPGKENLLRDIGMAIKAVRTTYPNTPLFLMGESMGGAALMSYCAQNECTQAEGLILAAPALWGDDFTSGLYHALLWGAAHVIPDYEWTGEDLDVWASDNLAILYAMGQDDKVVKDTRVDAVYGLVSLMRDAYSNAKDIRRPTLFLYGAKDQIVPPWPVANTIERMDAPLIVGYYDLGYHMLLRDLQREIVMYDIISWINGRYSPLPSGADMGWKEELLSTEVD